MDNPPSDLPGFSVETTERTILLVDDEENILSALRRLLRRDSYRILTASSGAEGLELLGRETVDVIVSDQRMPNMSGTEFLRCAKEVAPHTVRIVLSGYTDLMSVTEAINEGAAYKFLTKPWDDDILRLAIREAFAHKWIQDENRMLHGMLMDINRELSEANRRLSDHADTTANALRTTQNMLHLLPVPLFGVDEQGMLALANQAAIDILGGVVGLGHQAVTSLPPDLHVLLDALPPRRLSTALGGREWTACSAPLPGTALGCVVVLIPRDGVPT